MMTTMMMTTTEASELQWPQEKERRSPLREKGANVAYNDPYFPTVGHGRHYALNMTNTPLDNLAQYDAVVIVTDHSSYDYKTIVEQSQLVIDTRNATKGINSPKILRC